MYKELKKLQFKTIDKPIKNGVQRILKRENPNVWKALKDTFNTFSQERNVSQKYFVRMTETSDCSCWKGCGAKEQSAIVGGTEFGTMGTSVAVPQENGNWSTLRSS